VVDKKQIRSDIWLRRFMKLGIPAGLISILCLWIGRELQIEGLFPVFLFTMIFALIVGFAYNIRFVMLSIRQAKKESGQSRAE